MDLRFEYITNLQYKLRALSSQVALFESGEKYVKIQIEYERRLAAKDREIKRLKRELADARCQVVNVRNIWEQIVDDLGDEHSKAISKRDHEIEKLKAEIFGAYIRLDAEREKNKDKSKELMQIKTELEEEQGKVLKLKAQINRDYENSSKPSSMSPNHKKIVNNREKTGKRPGGQPGHVGHPRKRHTPTSTIEIAAPDEFTDTAKFRPTNNIVTKQMVDISVNLIVSEYFTREYRDLRTRQRVHADFPEGVVNDVNYGGSVKAFAFLLNNRCNVSIVNVADFLSELTGGELNISTGMINGLAKEFSLKTEADQKKAFADLQLSPVMNVDLTTARVNGKNNNVTACATPSTAMYFAKKHKGHEGVKDTPVENYQRTLVHDHDRTFYKYGGAHQECLEHCSRYLKDSEGNEPNIKWNRQMRKLIGEMIHFRNGLNPEDKRNPDEIDPIMVANFETKYDEILGLAKEEYEYEPPSKYYINGFNLYKKMEKYKANHLLFLHDRRVPPTNNLAERLLRIVKRKQAQAMTFRSFEGLEYFCNSLGVVASLRAQGNNIYDSVTSKFNSQKKIEPENRLLI